MTNRDKWLAKLERSRRTAVPEVSAEVFAIGRSERGDLSAVLGGQMSRKQPRLAEFREAQREAWALLRLRIFERDNWRCRKCGRGGPVWSAITSCRCKRGGDPYEPSNFNLFAADAISKSRGRMVDTSRIPSAEAWRALVAELSIDVSRCP